ncbi:MAG: SH3 domain-containing protein [candidate division Zixibacteria bacterium]|nr:SH3 domain-containing protein [candidate division Zixibacteria bacterium]
MSKKATILVIALSLLILMTSNVLAYKKIKVWMPQTPEIELKGAKKIAILDFKPLNNGSREAGKFIADKMIEYMLTENRGIREIEGGLFSSDVEARTLIEGLSTKCFSVVERSRLESVLAEQSMTDIGLVDDAAAAKIGQLLGVDIMIYGEVSASSEDKNGYETRTYNRRKVQVGCLYRTVTVNASMRVVDTRSGEILGVKRLTRTADDKFCEGDNRDISSVGQLAGRCADNMAWFFTNQVNPWYALGEFELDKIKNKEFKDDAKVAAEEAEDLEIDKAYALYNKLYQADPYNPKFLYNMGVLYEVAGSFEKAKEMYDGAAMLKDEDKYKEAAERIANRVRLVPFYASLDMAIVPHDFEAAAKDESLLAQKITVKGGSGDRREVYAEPSESSNVEAKIPGGVQLEVIEADGDWYLVKLLGDKQGYIHKDDCDD